MYLTYENRTILILILFVKLFLVIEGKFKKDAVDREELQTNYRRGYINIL